LSGIAKFTIADEAIVSDSDLGVNFFLDESSRGRSRAECCTELLLELNPEVEGHWWPESNVRPMAPCPVFDISFHVLTCDSGLIQL
jgi:amyloid beta precursor protein binding protein 1